MSPALASTTRLDIPSQNARYVPVFKERSPASTPGSFKSLCVCADHSEFQFGSFRQPRRFHPSKLFLEESAHGCAGSCEGLASMVGLGGLEPPASPLSGVRSNHLSYRPDVVSVLPNPAWWSLSGSNRRPPACKAGALPAELKPLA